MRIKKFTAPSMKEAMAQMKKELGGDAVILKSNKVKSGGILDFIGKEMFEILAAVDKGTPTQIAAPASSQGTITQKPVPAVSGYLPAVVEPAQVQAPLQAAVQPVKANFDKMHITMLQSELSEIRQDLAQVGQFLKYKNVPSLPKNLQMAMKQLIDNEVEENLARKLVEDIQQDLKGNDYEDLRLIISLLLNKIGGMIRVANKRNVEKNGPKVVTLVGPTGVGKTTTIAKLATNQKLLNKKKVALISADTFRIGAVDQLKTFANIADIPLTVVYKPEDMRKAIRNYSDMDVIYIDTTGRSQRDSERLNDLKKFIDNAKPDENHLVLSVTTRNKDLLEVTKRFSSLKYNRLLLTKLDETTSLGVILNLVSQVRQPVSYVTSGQNVPEDIERATVKKLARMIVRRKSN